MHFNQNSQNLNVYRLINYGAGLSTSLKKKFSQHILVWFPKLSVSIHSNTSINCTTSRFFNFTASKLSMYAQFWCWVIGSWQMPSKSGESIEKVDNWWWMAARMWLQFDRRTTAGASWDLTELRASDPMGHHTWVDTIREVKVG